ncbi:type II toxin-antitoxin system VapC family toxin [Larkinella sp. VNQ87]|uniref:type II toxin-antitoxin system VapC family toxin n=1 Tax=Larkinella sp. VNQ87 TaxID=3400921 RepID=UPI003C0D6A38
MIDTNAFIDYFVGLMPPNGLNFMDGIFNTGPIITSVICQIELLGFQMAENDYQTIRKLLTVAEIIPLVDLTIIEKAILVRRETKLKLPDAVIAATALIRDLTLISRNEKDFARVSGLTLLNPHSL